jgi:protein TonB
MTPTDQRAPAPSLTARLEERILAPLRRSPWTTRWFVVSLVSVLGLHAALLAWFLSRDRATSELLAKPEPTPVEIVVETTRDQPKAPPKPEPPKPEPPKAPQRQELEKPASSAPRAPTEDKVDTQQLQKETRAPKTPAPAADGRPAPSKEASSPSDEPVTPDKVEEEAAKPDVLEKDAEALDKAKRQPSEKPKKIAKTSPRAKTRRATTALDKLAGASILPDYTFAKPTKKSPVSGGTEDSRYLAIVYGMIMQHRAMVSIPGNVAGDVTIAFNVDDDGNVVSIGVQHTSGYPAVDAEAAAAIRRASPFPPPPVGAPHGLVATINFGEMGSSYEMGSRGR